MMHPQWTRRLVVAAVLLYVFLILGSTLGFMATLDLGYYVVGGFDLLRQAREDQKTAYDSIVLGIALIIGPLIGGSCGVLIWYLLVRRTKFLTDQEFDLLLARPPYITFRDSALGKCLFKERPRMK